ncbi:MAG: S8 family serine peptidase, partial [Telluria sp.]
NLDAVLFIEVEQRSEAGHDQSMATNAVDYIRGSGFLGTGVVLGLLDTGAMLGTAAQVMHQDLNKSGCGRNFTDDAAGVWNDENGHGSHVLGTIAGTGTAQARYRGVAPRLGNDGQRIRVGKVWGADNSGLSAWTRDAIDFMSTPTRCGSRRPDVINLSGGARGVAQNGTDATSRKLDEQVWATRQAYIVCSGNSGPGAQTIWSPGVAKNAFTVGNVFDFGASGVGELTGSSSRGPTGDGRMKPNLVATGNLVTSVRAGTTNGYIDNSGCSMATPHVSGIAASLLEHYPDFRNRPHLLRAHMMSSSILHSDQVTPATNSSGGRNDYGIGRVADYQAHWSRSAPDGWNTRWSWMTNTSTRWGYVDVNVPEGTRRLVVVMTWDEPAASAGAARAVTYDMDLWADHGANCVPDSLGQCGEWASQSDIDNVEYLIINSPPAGTYRLKASNWRTPASGLPVAIAATVIRGDPTPAMAVTAAPSTTTPPLGSTFTITTRVTDPAYAAYGVHMSVPTVPAGLTLLGVSTTREDGVAMDFPAASMLTLGTVTAGDSREATWRFRADTRGAKTVNFRAWSNNAGTVLRGVTVTP